MFSKGYDVRSIHNFLKVWVFNESAQSSFKAFELSHVVKTELQDIGWTFKIGWRNQFKTPFKVQFLMIFFIRFFDDGDGWKAPLF